MARAECPRRHHDEAAAGDTRRGLWKGGEAVKRLALLPLGLALACSANPPPKPVPPKAAVAPPTVAAAPDPEAWRNARPESGTRSEHAYPPVQFDKLPNGLSLYVVHKPAGVVSLSVVARGGASRLPAGKSGLAAFTARMMTEGTKKKSALQLAEGAESVGTAIEESAGRDFVRLGMTSLREDLKPALTLLSEVVREPAFAPAEIERVRHEWLDSVEAERQSPQRLASLVGLRLLLGTTVGAPVNGSRHDVEKLSRDDLLRFYGENFVPENVALVVVGDVTMEDVRPIAAELVGTWKGRPSKFDAATPSGAVPDGKKVFFVDRPGAVQSALFVAQQFPKRSEPGHEAREVLNTLLGGIFTSRLNMNLREEHAYTYGATSLDMATRDWGAFAVMTQVRTDVTGAALVEALAEVKRARDPGLGRPIADTEVDVARADLEQHLGATLVRTDDVGERVEQLFVHDLPIDYLQKYPTILDSVTPTTAAVVAQKLDPDRSVIVVVGDKAAVSAQLASRGFTVEAAPEALSD
jgi:zinc protease